MATQLLETIALRSTVVGALGLLGILVVSCGTDVTCGAGTTKKGSTCVVSASAGDGGPTSGDGGPSATPMVSFDGVTSVAPATDTALQVTWLPGSASLTPTNQIVYNVYLGTATGKENFKAPTAVSPPGATSIVVANLQKDTPYFVVVRAVDQDNNMDVTDPPKELTASTGADTTAPTFGGATSATAVKGSGNSITVSWDPAMDDLTPAEGMAYQVFWSDSSSKGSLPSTVGAITAPGATSAVVSHLPKPLTEYSFYVRARDAAGNEDKNDIIVTGTTGADEAPPVFGGCVAVTNPGAANATVSWEPAVDDTSTPEHITYNVYAVTTPVDDMTAFNLPNGTFTGTTSGVVQGLMPQTQYYFVCRAQDEAANEDTNTSYRVATTLSDNKPPKFAGISNTALDATTATLTWEAATDNETDPSQIQYVVYQSTDPNPASDPANKLSPGPELGATSITISELASNTLYFWSVVAQDSAGNATAPSTAVSGTTKVSFEGDLQPFFTANCAKSGCHSNDGPMQGQDLSEGNAYSNIVGVPTRYDTDQDPNFGCVHLNRVQPGDPSKSFILYKLKHSKELTSLTACTPAQLDPSHTGGPSDPTGCCTCAKCTSNQWYFGLGMPKDLCLSDPPNCPGLPEESIALIEAWINQGAIDN